MTTSSSFAAACATICVTICGAICVAPAAAAAPDGRYDFDTTPGRLPKTVLPEQVALTLRLDPASPRFDGTATMALRVRRPVAAIVLHAHALDPGHAELIGVGRAARRLRIDADRAAQTWRLVPADGRPIGAGAVQLAIRWRGRVQHTGDGLFAVPTGGGGADAQRPAMLATQLEAVYARTVFPAFDEPAFRSRYTLTVQVPAGMEALSNMPLAARSERGATTEFRFVPTPPMPAYLFAVAVGRFDALEGSAGGVPLRILTAPGKRAQGAYALAVTQQVLPFYDDYFGIRYALPKLDQLAVPAGRSGAMEDWGLISYAESALLVDPDSSNARTERRVFGVVAHEIAHQWFGNLVTAASWQEIWLNEAFATWMAEKAEIRFRPQWQTALNRRRDIDGAMTRDAGNATRPIRSGPVSEAAVFDVFDDITYTKGGAVLSMVEAWVGADSFQHGLAAYMHERRFSNATAADLWWHVGRASGRDVAGVVAGWTDRPGFPLVSVASRCDGGRTIVELAQRRFGVDAGGAPWKIPLTLQFGAGERRELLLERAQQTLALEGCPAEPLLVNASGEGYYRVGYAPAAQQTLLQRWATLPATARATLLADTLALAQTGVLPLADYVALLGALAAGSGPEQPALLGVARAGIAFLDTAFAGNPAQAALRQAARALYRLQLAALGWEPRADEDSEVALLRLNLIRDLALYGDQPTLDRTRTLFDAEQDGRPLLPATRDSVVFGAGVGADAARFAQLVARLKAAASDEERWLYANAIAAVRDPALARQAVALAVDPAVVDQQALALPWLMAHNSPNGDIAYRWAVEHWPALAARAGTMFGQRSALLPGAASGANDVARARELLADQQRLVGAPGRANAARSAAAIELAAAVKAREAARIGPALDALAAQLTAAGS